MSRSKMGRYGTLNSIISAFKLWISHQITDSGKDQKKQPRVLTEGRYEQARGVRMIKEEGAAYFARERGNKVEVGLYLEHIIEERGMKKKDIVRKLNLEESYARKLFGGQRIPTRKILLQCAFLLSLDLSDTQRLLDIGQKPRLYPRVRYDAAIIYGLEEKMTLEEMNSFLDEIGEEILL